MRLMASRPSTRHVSLLGGMMSAPVVANKSGAELRSSHRRHMQSVELTSPDAMSSPDGEKRAALMAAV